MVGVLSNMRCKRQRDLKMPKRFTVAIAHYKKEGKHDHTVKDLNHTLKYKLKISSQREASESHVMKC